MGAASSFGMNNFQHINYNMNQINNFNGLNNLMQNQYNQMNPMLNQINTYYQGNPMLNCKGNYNQNNPILNQMHYNTQENPMPNKMGNFNLNNPIMIQVNNFNQNKQMFNQINNFNQMNNQMMNQLNQNNQMNQMMSQGLMIQKMNQMMNQINQNMNQKNQKMKQNNQNMNQKNEISQEKRIKEKTTSQDLYNLDENQMDLIISIIKFYEENGNEYMNFDNPDQIKNLIDFLSLNNHKLEISDNIEEPLYYIEEPKKIIKFINSNYKEYKVNIPQSLTKYDIYSIAQKYKCFKNNKKHLSGKHSNILLINNNLILNRDETSIECINNNDIIFIIEPRNFPDDSYYNSLQDKTEDKGCIEFEFSSGKSPIYRVFPYDIKICEIYKSINLELGLDTNTYKLLYSGGPLEIYDQQEATFLIGFTITILDYNIFNKILLFGKIVIAKIKSKTHNCSESIGILNSIYDLKELILNLLGKKKIKELIIENKEIEEGDIRSLFSLGIKNDFTCFVECEE